MGPDDEKKLRQLMLQKRQLPQPNWDLLRRVTKRKSKAVAPFYLSSKKIDEAVKGNEKRQPREEVESSV